MIQLEISDEDRHSLADERFEHNGGGVSDQHGALAARSGAFSAGVRGDGSVVCNRLSGWGYRGAPPVQPAPPHSGVGCSC